MGDAKGDSVDPMSDEPADIYITRDPITQEGWGPLGRFVCAIFVGENEGFVEITMHPEDWGLYSPVPRPGEPANGLSADEATEAARAGLPQGDEWMSNSMGRGRSATSSPTIRTTAGTASSPLTTGYGQPRPAR